MRLAGSIMRSSVWRGVVQREGAVARLAQWKNTSSSGRSSELGSVVIVAAAAAVAVATNWSGDGSSNYAPPTRADEAKPHTIPGGT